MTMAGAGQVLDRRKVRPDTTYSMCSMASYFDEEEGQALSSAQDIFGKAFRRLVCVQRLGSVGVKSGHIMRIKRLSDESTLLNCKLANDFLVRMLNYSPLMGKVAHELKDVHDALFGDCTRSKSSVFGVVVRAIHHVKKAAIASAWRELDSSNEQLSSLRIQYDSLKKQFTEARIMYLKEISELREATNSRQGSLKNDHNVTFYEPIHSLLPEERKFFLDMMEEQLKSIEYTNSSIDRQMQKLRDQVESDKVEQLQKSLHQKSEELEKLRNVILSQNDGKPMGPSAEAFEKASKLQTLLDENHELRDERRDAQRELNKAAKELECAQVERDELSEALSSASTVTCTLKQECAELRKSVQSLERSKIEIEESKIEIEQKLTEKIEELKRSLTQEESKTASLVQQLTQNRGRSRPNSRPGSFRADQADMPSLAAPVYWGHSENSMFVKASFAQKIDDGQALSQEREQRALLNDDSPLDSMEGIEGGMLLEQGFAELQQTMVQEANDLKLEHARSSETIAGSESEQVCDNNFAELQPTIVQEASDLLLEHARPSETSGGSESEQVCDRQWAVPDLVCPYALVAFLFAKSADVTVKVQNAAEIFLKEFEDKHSTGGSNLSKMAKLLADFRCQQAGFEEIAPIYKEAGSDKQQAARNNQCSQQCQNIMHMLRQLQHLCTEMCANLGEAFRDNVQLSSTVDMTLTSLDLASRSIRRSKTMRAAELDEDLLKGVDALEDAKLKCGQHRLCSTIPKIKRKWELQRQQILESRAKDPLLVLDDTADPSHMHRKSGSTSQAANMSKRDEFAGMQSDYVDHVSRDAGNPIPTVTKHAMPSPVGSHAGKQSDIASNQRGEQGHLDLKSQSLTPREERGERSPVKGLRLPAGPHTADPFHLHRKSGSTGQAAADTPKLDESAGMQSDYVNYLGIDAGNPVPIVTKHAMPSPVGALAGNQFDIAPNQRGEQGHSDLKSQSLMPWESRERSSIKGLRRPASPKSSFRRRKPRSVLGLAARVDNMEHASAESRSNKSGTPELDDQVHVESSKCATPESSMSDASAIQEKRVHAKDRSPSPNPGCRHSCADVASPTHSLNGPSRRLVGKQDTSQMKDTTGGRLSVEGNTVAGTVMDFALGHGRPHDVSSTQCHPPARIEHHTNNTEKVLEVSASHGKGTRTNVGENLDLTLGITCVMRGQSHTPEEESGKRARSKDVRPRRCSNSLLGKPRPHSVLSIGGTSTLQSKSSIAGDTIAPGFSVSSMEHQIADSAFKRQTTEPQRNASPENYTSSSPRPRRRHSFPDVTSDSCLHGHTESQPLFSKQQNSQKSWRVVEDDTTEHFSVEGNRAVAAAMDLAPKSETDCNVKAVGDPVIHEKGNNTKLAVSSNETRGVADACSHRPAPIQVVRPSTLPSIPGFGTSQSSRESSFDSNASNTSGQHSSLSPRSRHKGSSTHSVDIHASNQCGRHHSARSPQSRQIGRSRSKR